MQCKDNGADPRYEKKPVRDVSQEYVNNTSRAVDVSATARKASVFSASTGSRTRTKCNAVSYCPQLSVRS